jgi:membrane associated rhomboid family serine protease
MTVAFLLGFGLSLALVAGGMALRSCAGCARSDHRVPVLTLACVAIIAPFTFVQFTCPELLPALMRDTALVGSGQPWRLVTSLLVQDGGYADALFNLGGLLVVGVMAERLLGCVRWALVAGLSIAAAQAVALAWQPVGAGNSILNFGLAGSICAVCFVERRARAAIVPATAAGACFAVLLYLRDIHGAAAAAGALVTVVATRTPPRRRQRR